MGAGQHPSLTGATSDQTLNAAQSWLQSALDDSPSTQPSRPTTCKDPWPIASCPVGQARSQTWHESSSSGKCCGHLTACQVDHTCMTTSPCWRPRRQPWIVLLWAALRRISSSTAFMSSKENLRNTTCEELNNPRFRCHACHVHSGMVNAKDQTRHTCARSVNQITQQVLLVLPCLCVILAMQRRLPRAKPHMPNNRCVDRRRKAATSVNMILCVCPCCYPRCTTYFQQQALCTSRMRCKGSPTRKEARQKIVDALQTTAAGLAAMFLFGGPALGGVHLSV